MTDVRWTRLFMLAAAITIAPHLVLAQAGVVAGTAVAAGSLRALPGVQLTVDGQAGRTVLSDASGRFRITGLTEGATVVLTARAIGFRARTDTVRVGATNLQLTMSERVVELNQVVVTGTGETAQRRELGTSVAAVNVSDVMAQTAVPTIEGLLNGRAPGVAVIAATGQIGAGSQVRVRGVGTFSLSSSPLIYVDGVRANNTQTGLVARMNDFNPEEIESIEVLKGPAAATLYGTEAARGVINIITKKGAPGSTRFNVTAKRGENRFQNAEGRIPWNYGINPLTGKLDSINLVKSERERGTPLFRNGMNDAYDMNISGGSALYRFFVSGEWSNNEGIVTSNARTQKSARTNLSATPNSKLDLETSIGYITSHTTAATEGTGGGILWASEFARPERTAAFCAPTAARGCGWSRGAFTSPAEVYNATDSWQDLQRVTGSASVKFSPTSWMSHRFLIGTDYTLEDLQSYTPYQSDSVIVFFLGSSFDGSRSQTTQQRIITTYDYSGSARFDVRPNLVAKTAVGVQYYTNSSSGLSASGSHFPTPGLSTISATGTKGTPSSSYAANNTLGFYGQEEAQWNDRLFLTGAVRVDNNSAFGSKAGWASYPKLSASWVASEEPMVRGHLPQFIDNLRLRGAYGASGQQPGVNTALRTLSPVAGPNGATVLTTGTYGNLTLKPERVVGSELGFEAGMLGDRLGVDFTFFNDVSHDAILSRSVSPSTGFGGTSQFINAGRIDKHGIELGLRGQVINRRDFGWDLQINVATNASTIKQLSGAVGDTSIDLGTAPPLGHRVGYSPFDLFTYNVVSATYDATTKKATNPMCMDSHGAVAPCFVPGTTNVQAPKVYFGHSLPTNEGSLASTLRFYRIRFYAMADFQRGFNKLDNNLRIRCQLNSNCEETVFPEKFDPAVVAQVQNSGTLRNYFIKPASFTKLRELSLSYDAPSRFASKIGAQSLSMTLSGRNLGTWTRYTGLDPENSLGGQSGSIALDQSEFPQLTSFVFGLRLSY
jgi:TonB-dependent SusC/RagA subfamily outer membrane receptor